MMAAGIVFSATWAKSIFQDLRAYSDFVESFIIPVMPTKERVLLRAF